MDTSEIDIWTDEDYVADVRERVERGMSYMDDVLPGWYKVINLDYLNMAASSPTNPIGVGAMRGLVQPNEGCILCQLDTFIEDGIPENTIRPEKFGEYDSGLRHIQTDDNIDGLEFGPEFGFDLFDEKYGCSIEYSLMTELWKEGILERRG